jgi:hypothetical protein
MMKRLFACIVLLLPIAVCASHLRGGQIKVTSDGLQCHIELRLLTNTGSPILAGGGVIDFGDGTVATTETKANVIIKDQPSLGVVVYTFDHTYALPGAYLVWYSEPNLTAGILNMTNSDETRFSVETFIQPTPSQSFASPDFPTDPIFVWPSQHKYSFSTAAIDEDPLNEYYYKYSLVTDPAGVHGYEIPDGLTVNEDTGIITWDTKFHGQYSAGLFWIAVRVWKLNKNNQYLTYAVRAIQLTVEDSGSRIDLLSTADPKDKVVVANGQQRKIKLILMDDKAVDSLRFDIYHNKLIDKNISFNQYDSVSDDLKFKLATLSLNTSADIASDLPYAVTIRGHASYIADVTFLYMTKDVDLPKPIDVVSGLPDKEQMKVYPNPFHSEVYISGAISSDALFINSLGHEVMRSSLQEGRPVNTTGLPAGFYILQVTDGNGRNTSFKVIRN